MSAPTTLSPPATARDPYRVLDDLVHAQLAQFSGGLSPISLALAQADWFWHLAASPGRLMELGLKAQEGARAVTETAIGEDGSERDPRFAEAAWAQWPFNLLKTGFTAAEAWWREALKVDGLSAHHRHMVDFFTRQALDSISPANWPFTNPTVLKAAVESGGRTLAEGAERWLADAATMNARDDDPASPLPPLPFAVGRDVAVTPGQVVFRNPLFELIQYTPTTPTVRNEPLLIVPSCIMKYYILDLSPANSMVRYLVGQGFTVFVMSWRNPEASDRDLGMQDYLRAGVMQALAATRERSGAARVHAMGYCLGGTFLAIVAAAMARAARRRRESGALPPQRRAGDFGPDALPELASVTLLAAQTDFGEPGELGVFIDDDQLRTLRETMARSGYLSGRAMAGSFQFLNSHDLVWTAATRRYLLGQNDTGNDMMSWNLDVTRLPERMHNEYLSSLFLNNALAGGHYRFGGEGVALMDIDMPLMVVGTVRDHVSPWRSVYKIHLLTDTDTTFILAAGGHNAGIVSEPGHPKRSYQIDHAPHGHGWVAPDEWAARAPLREGSWWPAWSEWLAGQSSGERKPPKIAREHVLAPAPGTYVMTRYAD